ncbi:MAG: hypothetical protein JRF02_04595 [Deltaproteobacteria bacterium]|jgi:hypothetical protein|nr:hypothetical protein [Deltaproteobacteria bacterium]
MKKIVIITVWFIVAGIALNAQAASVTFNPPEVVLQVAPGQTGRTYIKVDGYSNKAYSLYFLVGTKRKKSNIPHGWMTSAYLWLESETAGTSSNAMILVVDVPQNAKPGTYSALLEPDDLRSSEPIVSSGVSVTIEVPDPQKKGLLSDARY